MTTVTGSERAVGRGVGRIEGPLKVTGRAHYAGEYHLDGLLFGWVVQSTVARGRIRTIHTSDVLGRPAIVGVLTHENAPRLGDGGDPELRLLQDDRVHYRGQVVALVVARTSEQARDAAETLTIDYDIEDHEVVLNADSDRVYEPEKVNPDFPARSTKGDVDTALTEAAFTVDQTYSTPAEQNSPMEPHAATVVFGEDGLLAYDSNQGAFSVKGALASLFDLDPAQVQVRSEHVGGGFGSKGSCRPPVVLAAMASREFDHPVRVTLTRPQLFSLVGYRTPTEQRVRLGANSTGNLTALDHRALSQTSTVDEFAEQTAVISRVMYATDNLTTSHMLAALDVPTPRWMRAPGEAPGSFALESAMDELAEACGIDPVTLRLQNEPDVDPDEGLPFSSRNLVACLNEGARRFGWDQRDATPRARRDGRWLLGTGVACSTYPARSAPSTATVHARFDGTYVLDITAADIGTGARTALTQIAADELDVTIERVVVRIGDSDFGQAMIAGGSMGTASWSWAVTKACADLRGQLADRSGAVPAEGLIGRGDTTEDIKALGNYARHAFGAQFVEAAVDERSGEVRVRRMTGVFAAGHIVNAVTARSQLIGGMTMGLSMALHEESVMDAEFGDYLNHNFADYHIASNADVPHIDVAWIDETDDHTNPGGIKGIGEIGIVGTAAAIANAVHHATGRRQRTLPIRPDRILTAAMQ